MKPLVGLCVYFLKDFIYLLLEKGEGRKTSMCEKCIDWLPPICPQSVGRRALNPLSHTSQGWALSLNAAKKGMRFCSRVNHTLADLLFKLGPYK